MEFITLKEEMGVWDVDQINKDLENLFTSNGYDWQNWKGLSRVIKDGKIHPDIGTEVNLTSDMSICTTTHERLFKHSGRYRQEGIVEHHRLTTIIPEIEGTYTEELIRKMQEIVQGKIRVRLHNRTTRIGLYWHQDLNSDNRYHLVLWTNPGHFLVWTDQFKTWDNGFDPEECKKTMRYNAEFIPADGKVRLLATHDMIHGVANIGVGFRQPVREQSRCHLTFWKV